MNWNTNEQSDSDNEMFQMSSSRMQEDNSHVRLLSVSEEEDIPELSPRDAGLPHLRFRHSAEASLKAKEEKKSRTAVISILVIGLAMIVIINIGLAIKLKGMHDEDHGITNATCPMDSPRTFVKCNQSFPWQNYRLPDTLHPEHYDIFLHPNLTLGNYTGVVNITVTVTKPTDKIILHSRNLIIESIKVYKNFHKMSAKIAAEDVMYTGNNPMVCKEQDFLAIPLKENLMVGKQYLVHIEFVGNLTQALRGFYLSKYKTKSGENRTMATTQFESTDARAAFPCFDEPAFKANFTLSIVRDNDFIALSNMPVKNTKDFSPELKLDEFETSKPMSTYLVAFIICEFKGISKTIDLMNGPVKVSVYAAPDRIDTADFALNVSCEVMKFYEKSFKIAYPLPKLDLIAVPDFEAGAMENWGLVTYRQTYVLWDKNSSSIKDQEMVALVIAHEFAHQWFGNLVTMKWWNDLWLNEGFASYMEYYAVDKIKPQWDFLDEFYSDHTYSAMRTDQSEYTHPISVPVDSKIQIEELFDSISYSKGACLIQMVIDYLGEKNFLNGVGDYLQKFAYGNTENQDLVRSVAARANSNELLSNILHMLDSWTSEPGFPVINVCLSGSEVVMTQNRYLLSVKNENLDPRCDKSSKNPLWKIPVSYITDLSNTKSWEFFETKTMSFSVDGKPSWMVFNAERGGYYLVNYSKDLLAALAAQLRKDHSVISPTDRAGILFNAAKSARAGYMTYDVLFDLLSYIKNEKDYEPIVSAVDALLSIVKYFKIQFDSESYHKIKLFSNKLFKHLYEEYGWPKSVHVDESLSHPQIKLRRLIVGVMCTWDDSDCTSEALKRFNSMKSNNTQVDRDYKNTVYTIGIRYGTPGNWDYMWDKYANDLKIDSHEKEKLLRALCHTTEEKRIAYLLDEALKGEHIRFQDTASVVSNLQWSRVGSYMVWKFIRAKWAKLKAIYPMGSNANRHLLNIFGSFTDKSDIAAAEEFIESNNMTDLRYAKRALDAARFNVHWIDTYQPQIVKWLNDNLDKV